MVTGSLVYPFLLPTSSQTRAVALNPSISLNPKEFFPQYAFNVLFFCLVGTFSLKIKSVFHRDNGGAENTGDLSTKRLSTGKPSEFDQTAIDK